MPHCNKKMLSFFITTKCNLCCRYCYNAKERNAIKEQTISLDFAKAGIDWYFNNNKSRHIRFYGPGEPTQEFEIMKAITEYAQQHHNNGERVTVELQTNGIFNKDVCKWILKNVNIVWMSFDGMPEIQDYNRPINPIYSSIFNNCKSSEIMERNVREIISNSDKNIMVGARVTITDNNINKQTEMIDYFYNLGIQNIWTDPLFYGVGEKPVCEDKEKQCSYHFDMDSYVNNYIDAYQYANEKGVFWGSFLTVNFDGCSEYHCRCCDPLSAPHLTTDGYISACDMALLGKNAYHMSPFIVAKWDSVYGNFIWYNDRIKALNNRKSTNMRHCADCPAKMHCGGYCLGEIVNESGDFYGNNPIKCKAIKTLYKKLGDCEPYPYLHP